MKRTMTLLLCLALTLTAAAQTQIPPAGTDTLKHLEFMETPITGTLNSFVNKMIKKGLTFSKVTEEGVAIFKGDFGGYKDCEIYVYSVNMGKRGTSVAVSLPFRDTWPELSGDYEDMKKLLTKKMGQPYASIEVFENPVPYDNRMLYVTTDRCDYKTTWRRDHGVIAVAINNAEYDHKDYSNVRIIFMDFPDMGKLPDQSLIGIN